MQTATGTPPAIQGTSGAGTAADDARLVVSAQENPRAFAPLYARYADPVYRYCYRKLDHPETAAGRRAVWRADRVRRRPLHGGAVPLPATGRWQGRARQRR